MNTCTLPTRTEASTNALPMPDFEPARIVEIELGQPLPTLSATDEQTGQRYHRALCLVRLHSQPLGRIELLLEKNTLEAKEYVHTIWQSLSAQINQHLQQDGLPPISEVKTEGLPRSVHPSCVKERDKLLTDAPLVSVIVPTHDRPERLAFCLQSLLSLHYPQYEIIIVDNAPSTHATADLIQQTCLNNPRVHYIREDRPGPSWARNCGIARAKGEILAFVDDDVIVDRYWLVEMVRAFDVSDKVVCVTSLILPLELETPAQIWFEEYGGFSKGFTQRVFDMAKHHPKQRLYPYCAGKFGTGASMAFTAEFLHRVGGFDPALGGNGPSPCGQDIALFFQVIVQGYQLVYAPASLVYHLHRRDYEALRKQIYNYGVGFTGYLTKSLLENPHLLFDLVTKVPYGLFLLLSPRAPKNRKKQTHYPNELTKLELQGMVFGPLAYLRSRLAMRKLRKIAAPLEVQVGLHIPKEI
jgi:GT2 family glycosyltransferase